MIKLLQPTPSKMYIVHLHQNTLYFSYNTVVGCSNSAGNFRTDKYYSRTTLRHLEGLGIDQFLRVSQVDFDAEIERTIKELYHA